uniref:ST3 beta-galactoside alpha-2,3-sialyltransferase 3 n=1 Tax=Homo sapiens TaxID=9606 RepID=A0A2R8Y7D5_HUMAN
MGLLVFVRNLLLALCLFLVLGFLYYSAWKLHLLQWEEDSKDGLFQRCVPLDVGVTIFLSFRSMEVKRKNKGEYEKSTDLKLSVSCRGGLFFFFFRWSFTLVA